MKIVRAIQKLTHGLMFLMKVALRLLKGKDPNKPLPMWFESLNIFLRKFHFIRKLVSKLELNSGNLFSIYPIDVPEITVRPNLDFLVLELPPRYIPFMPNGIGYLYNILKKEELNFQVIDSNIVFYHKYHSERLLKKKSIVTKDGYKMPDDPWDPLAANDWEKPEVLDYFMPQIEEIIFKISKNPPKAIGISIHGSNRSIAKRFVKALRKKIPDIIVMVGGYDCVYPDIAPVLFSDFDYMFIGETELTIGPFMKKFLNGEKPIDQVGIISKFDTPERTWTDTPLPENLDEFGFPLYEWTDKSLYLSYAGKQSVPITATRGCKWGKCRFCAECFSFRQRDPEKVVDEIEYFTKNGFFSFQFNESDVNGNPQSLYEICSGIIRRNLKVHLMGQLRINKKNTQEYFEHLSRAGFKYLRFGVDGWSDRILQLQKKGYNMRLVKDNLKNCKTTGIYTAVNIVIGIPGETEADVDEMIQNLLECKDDYDMLSQVNTLILAGGSHYFKFPEQHNIRFRGDRKKIYQKNPYFIPVDLWYSENPYIDQEIRIKRVDRILNELENCKVNISESAYGVVGNLKTKATGSKAK